MFYKVCVGVRDVHPWLVLSRYQIHVLGGRSGCALAMVTPQLRVLILPFLHRHYSFAACLQSPSHG